MSLFTCYFNPSSNELVSADAQRCVQRSNDHNRAFTWGLFLLWLFSRVVRRPSLVSWSFLFAKLKARAENKQNIACIQVSCESFCSVSYCTYWRISICLSRLSLSSEKDLIRASSLCDQTRKWFSFLDYEWYSNTSMKISTAYICKIQLKLT